ncbi:hypothetical protein AWC38_SpisGene23586 [Stylophora pistillata]|uniref:DUF5641 domain-containing protein n=1 Tax=Stylophora pistillata TaxID=50429 RepID=A0A2B4R7W1_STYPI|nr:hypothetical protein AWC38_SpisGene23586 [Stylophora pistillata]
MDANKAKGYIRELEPAEIDNGPSWYLPRFSVVKEDKETTKVRIVYDSAARYGGVSLNDTMLPRPKLQDNYPLAVNIILLQMYMDDIMTSLKTDDEAIKARNQLRELLGKTGFKIRRWCSNRPEVRPGWLRRTCTWLLGLGWDDEFACDLKKTCQEWFRQLPELSGDQVPRCYHVADKIVEDNSIPTMVDASLLAYAALEPTRVTAWVRRFADLFLAKVKKYGKLLGVVSRSGLTLTPIEVDRGGKLWVKQAQEERFPEEIKDLIGRKEVRRQSQLKLLTPIVDEQGGQLAPQVADDIASNPRNRWRLIQNLVRLFWKCWREEYLPTLNTRKKWREAKENLKVGDVVLVVDQNASRSQWHLGGVQQVFRGQDGQVHVVQVSRRGQKFIRPITRLCPLNVAGQPEYKP